MEEHLLGARDHVPLAGGSEEGGHPRASGCAAVGLQLGEEEAGAATAGPLRHRQALQRAGNTHTYVSVFCLLYLS